MELLLNILFVLFFKIFGIPAPLSGELPGSRGLIVENHAEQAEILEVSLRKCYCGLSQEDLNPCKCWGNFSHEDQPAVQGDPRIILNYFLSYTSDEFGFQEKKGNTILRLPSPTYLAQILESLELDSYFQFMPTHELLGPDLYLQLISEGRIPISFIANEGIALLSYQNYFHDMFHHLFIWIYIPKKLKDLICSRAKTIVEFSKSIEQTLQTEELQLFWKLIIFRVGMRFDNATGTLNNKLFDLEKLQQRAFRASRVEEFNFIRSSQNITQIGVLLEAAINFGRLFSRDDKEVFAQTILDENEFLYQLFHDLVNSTAELLHGKDSNLKGAIHSQPEFDGLFDLNDRELRAIREHLLEEIMALTRYNPAQGGHLTNLISFDEFMKGISKQMNNLYGKTKSMKHRF